MNIKNLIRDAYKGCGKYIRYKVIYLRCLEEMRVLIFFLGFCLGVPLRNQSDSHEAHVGHGPRNIPYQPYQFIRAEDFPEQNVLNTTSVKHKHNNSKFNQMFLYKRI